MNVLKMGYENEDLPTMEVTCTGQGIHNKKKACGAVLEVNFLDITRAIHHDYGGGSDEYYYVTCPVCGVKTEVYKSKMPAEIRDIVVN